MTTPNLGSVPEGAANFGSFAAYAAKTEEDWRAQTRQPLDASIDDLLSGLWSDLPTGAAYGLTLITELAKKILPLEQIAEWTGIGEVLTALGSWAGDLNGFIAGVWQQIVDLFTWISDTLGIETALKPLLTWLGWVWDQFGAGVDSFLKPIFTWLEWVWNLLGETGLKKIFEYFAGLLGDFTSLTTALPSVDQIVKSITGAVAGGLTELTKWVAHLPNISTLVSILTGKTEADGIPLDLGYLQTWATGLLHQTNFEKAMTDVIHRIIPTLNISIPVSNVTNDTPNLLIQNAFPSTTSISGGNGWEWDGTQSHTSGGGAAKVTCNGTLRELFSTQSIKVTAGDRINLSAYIETSGFTGSGAPIVLSMIPFIGTAQQATVDFATSGAATSWTQISGGPWTVPAGVTSLRVRMAVTAAATAGTVAWDDLSLTKSGMLGQGLVEFLTNAWNNLWNGLVGDGQGATKTWSDMTTAASYTLGRANTGITNAGTANGKIDTTNYYLGASPQSVIGSLNGVLMDGSSTIAAFLALLWDAFNGSWGSTGKTVSNVYTAGAGVRTTAGNGVTNAATANGRVDLTNNALFGATSAGTRIQGSALPTGVAASTAGSGAAIARTTNADYNPTSGRNMVAASFFNTTSISSADISVSSGRTFSVTYAGWYMVELSYRTGATASTGWNLAPLLYKNGTAFRIGTDAVLSWWVGGWSAGRYAQASWIVYLDAGNTVTAGYDCVPGTSLEQNIIKADSTGIETYFSIALLNRSYA